MRQSNVMVGLLLVRLVRAAQDIVSWESQLVALRQRRLFACLSDRPILKSRPDTIPSLHHSPLVLVLLARFPFATFAPLPPPRPRFRSLYSHIRADRFHTCAIFLVSFLLIILNKMRGKVPKFP